MDDNTSLDEFEPSTFRLTAARANRLRHRDEDVAKTFCKVYINYDWVEQLKLLDLKPKIYHAEIFPEKKFLDAFVRLQSYWLAGLVV